MAGPFGPLIWQGRDAKNLADDLTFSATVFDGMKVGNQLTHNASTGIISGGVLAINADTTKFNLSAGTGQVVDYTTPTNPSIIKVSWSAFTAQTVTGLASQDETYVMIDSAGVLSQLSNFPTPTERRAKIFIGRIGHSTRTAISFATSFPDYGQSVGSQMFDLYDALGPFNITGNQLTANGANLSFNKSSGSMFFRSFNYPTSSQTPSYVNSAAASPQSFVYRTQTTLNPTFITSVIPGSYDNAGTITAVGGGAGSSTIQRVYLSPNGTVQIQYGQAVYATLTEALASISSEAFVVNPGIINTGVLIAYLVLNKNCTALNDAATCRLLRAPKFETGVGGGVNTVTSLQQTYNSSSQPQIVLTSGQGGVQVYDNATPIGTDLFKVGSNGGTNFLTASATAVSTTLPVTTTNATASSSTTTGAIIATGGLGVGGAIRGGSSVNAGIAGSALGTLTVSGNTSGTVTIQPQAAAGTFNFNLPITAGTSGQVLTSGGGGSSAMTWTTITAPTVQKFLSGSGTYTTPTSPRVPTYIRVRMVGAGGNGGGASSNAAANGVTGGTGGTTTFGSSLLTCTGGGGGLGSASGGGSGASGTATIGSGPYGTALSGGMGSDGTVMAVVNTIAIGGHGGISALGGAGGYGSNGAAGKAAIANTGSGGGGGSGNQAAAATGGGGGGAGGFIDAIIAAPAASYAYAVGAVSGTVGTGGTGGGSGGLAGSGYVEVTEFYQ